MAKRKRRGPARLAADSARMYEAAVRALDKAHAAAVLPSVGASYDAANEAEVAHAHAAELLGAALEEAGITTPERAAAAGVGWSVDPATGEISPTGPDPGPAPLPPFVVLEPTDANLASVARAVDALARGLMPRHMTQAPAALLSADPDGRVRGLGQDLGDGDILWHSVALWHAVDRRDRGQAPR